MHRSSRGDVTATFRPCERVLRPPGGDRGSDDDDGRADRRELPQEGGVGVGLALAATREAGAELGLGLVRPSRRRRGSGCRGSRSPRCPSAGSGSSAAASPGRSTPSTARSGCRPRGTRAARCRTCCPSRATSARPARSRRWPTRAGPCARTRRACRTRCRPGTGGASAPTDDTDDSGIPQESVAPAAGGGGVDDERLLVGPDADRDRRLPPDDAVDEQVALGLQLSRPRCRWPSRTCR